MDSNRIIDPRGFWTNEKHVRYLNSMEASFVRTMFESNGHLLPLDRYVPDSSESTLDLKNQRRRKHVTSVDVLKSTSRNGSRTDRKTRRLSSQPYISSQDQVVPQLEQRGGDEDEREHPADVPVTPKAPVNLGIFFSD